MILKILMKVREKMNNINSVKAMLCSAIGAMSGIVTSFFGGWTHSMTTLLIFMGIDYLSGLFVAGVFKKSPKSESGALNSKISFKGLCKKAMMLLIVVMAHRFDMELGFNYLRDAVCVAFIINESISIVENGGLMGVKMPDMIKKAIDLLTDKENKN